MATGNIILAGLAGSGKSSVGRQLALACGLAFLDLDRETERLAGTSIRSLAAQDRWVEFRALETRALKALAGREGLVLALGGGTLLAPENRAAALALGTLVCLDAPDPELARRLEGSSKVRPLLAGASGAELLARVGELRAEREPGLGSCQHRLDTAGLTARQVALTLAHRLDLEVLELDLAAGNAPRHPAQPTQSHLVLRRGAAGDGALWATHLGRASSALVLTDETVAALHWQTLTAALTAAGLRHKLVILPPGEAAKHLGSVQQVLTEAAAFGLQRDGLVIGFGGGVVCDLAGLCAALYMRGVGLLQVPTTLLAMVDAAHGGKAAVDFAGHKNLLGQFWFPGAVLVDPAFLATLPPRELRSGLGEVCKAAVLGDADLWALLETQGESLLEDPALLDQVIRGAIRVKLGVVASDPLETGRRALLNFGHTIGHALEAATLAFGEEGLTHGEAVGIGMVLEAKLAAHRGLCDEELPRRLAATLKALGLPATPPKLDPEAVLAHLFLDKKNAGGRLRMVLPRAAGDLLTGVEVGQEEVEAVL
jgi:shikimate kinase/3-dehydroquinate synthase